MSHFKRRRCRRQVRCTLCTADRWKGNGKDRFKVKESRRVLDRAKREQEE